MTVFSSVLNVTESTWRLLFRQETKAKRPSLIKIYVLSSHSFILAACAKEPRDVFKSSYILNFRSIVSKVKIPLSVAKTVFPRMLEGVIRRIFGKSSAKENDCRTFKEGGLVDKSKSWMSLFKTAQKEFLSQG